MKKQIFGGSFITTNQQIAQTVIDIFNEKGEKFVLHKFCCSQYEVIADLDSLNGIVGSNNVFNLGYISL